MSGRSTVSWIIAVVVIGTATAWADDDGEKSFPKRIRVEVPEEDSTEGEPNTITLVRNGVGLCEWGWFRIDLYRAALYLEEISRDPNEIIRSEQAKKLHLVFSRSLSKEQSERAFVASFRANAKENLPRYQRRLDQLCSMMRDVRKGDSLTFTYLPGRGLESHFRGKSLGVIKGDDFARMFFKLYVGPIPPTQALRNGLIGLTEQA
jgi:hypothetical protein